MNHIAGNSIEGKWSCMDIVYNQYSEHKVKKKIKQKRWKKMIKMSKQDRDNLVQILLPNMVCFVCSKNNDKECICSL